MPEPVTLNTLLATYSNTEALKKGDVQSPLFRFNFADVEVANTQFKPFVREEKYDAGELAILTFLQAKEMGKAYSLLPAVVMGRGQLHTLAYNPAHGRLQPEDLNGKRVGVRSYTQTTGAWVRGMLTEQYGVDIQSIRWITFEDPHILEYKDPSWVERAAKDKNLVQMLRDGEIDAMIGGDKLADPGFAHLIPDHEAATERWAKAHGGVPINHMLVVRDRIVQEQPDVTRELFRVLKESTEAAGDKVDPAAVRFGVENVWACIDTMQTYALEQQLISRRFRRDEIFSDLTASLA